jgi:hypothetical protein
MSNSFEYKDPWTHWITDDFLSPEDFYMIKKLISRWPKGKPTDKVNVLLAEFHLFEETFLYQKEAGLIDAILMGYAKRLAKEYSIEGKYELIEISYSNCGAGYTYPVHVDSKHKILSNIIYMSDSNNGTRLYRSKGGEVYKTAPWRPNRMFTFQRTEDTWHDYISINGNRSTLSINFLSRMPRAGEGQKRKNYADRKNITESIWPKNETRLTLL